jgi:signal transduction histidine kinase
LLRDQLHHGRLPHARLPSCQSFLVQLLARQAQCRQLLWMFLLSVACAGSARAAPAIPNIDSVAYAVLESAEFVKTESLAPPPESAWQDVTLPDSWRKNKRNVSGYGWYRITFRTNANPQNAKAIYIPRITNNIEVFVNGVPVGMSGRVGEDFETSWNRAQYFLLPASALREGDNVLLLRLHPNNFTRVGIGTVQIGDARTLKEIVQRRLFLQIEVPQLLTAVLAVMAAFSFSIWLRRRCETMLLLFGWMSMAGIVRLAHHYMSDMPTWLGLLQAPAVVWLGMLQTCLCLHYAAQPMPRTERALLIAAAVATILQLIAAFTGYLWPGTAILYAAMIIASPFLLTFIIYQLSRKLNAANTFLIVAMTVNTIFGIHDFLNFLELLGFEQLYLLPMGLPLILLAVAALLAQRFVGTLTNYETLNSELASRVDQRERELAASYERERVFEQARVMIEERQRLMRDMHDGIGSHLMSTLALSRLGTLSNTQMSEVLSDCIDELKITIDSLEPVERDLLVVLGNLRYRLEPRLTAAGISLDWAVQDLPPLEYLDPGNVRSVLRIVQEAFTNTLKHAKATRIAVSTSVDYPKNRVLVRVADNGTGIKMNEVKSGRGIENMRARAVKLGGELELVPLPGGGTCMNLFLPISRSLNLAR